jgi:hypothetical protein
VTDQSGVIIGCHYLAKPETKEWFFTKGVKASPLVIGELRCATQIHPFESTWDGLSFCDRTSAWETDAIAVVITRGVSHAVKIRTIQIPENAKLYVWPQNDPSNGNGLPPSEKWFNDIRDNLDRAIYRVATPQKHADLNDWTRSGATATDLLDAMKAAEVIEAKTESTSAAPGRSAIQSIANDSLPQIVLPKLSRQESTFAAEMGQAIGPLNVLFRYQEAIVEIKDELFTEELDKSKLATGGLKFSILPPTRARTWVEEYVTTGIDVQLKNENGTASHDFHFVPHTMKQVVANGLLVSPQFAKHIPVIHRILDVPIPIKKRDGSVITPTHGFNAKIGIYCNPNAPHISLLPLEKAREVLDEALAGFAWKNKQSKVHALARVLTPYARGIMGFSARPPLWYFNGNRPRAGKDYLAGVPQIIYLGHPFEDAALGDDSEETRKRITAAIVSGRRMMHFGNCQGYVESAPFIQAITAPVWRTRALGSTSAESDLELPNEIEYSISANVGLTYREDLEPRLRKIELAFYEEHENARHFPKTFLHDWVADNRALILSAIASFFEFWISKGMPPGATPFNSFPEWASVVGGVMQTCNLGDPCLPHEDKDLIGGDRRTAAMNALYSLIFELRPDQWLTKKEICTLIQANQEADERLMWFGDFTGPHKMRTVIRAGVALSAFKDRIISGVALRTDVSDTHSERHQIRFEQIT